MRALVMGGSGLVGSLLIEQLCKHAQCSFVCSLGRSSIDAGSAKVEERVGALDNLESLVLGLKVDTAFCCLGTTIAKAGSRKAFAAIDWHLVTRLARLSKQLGIENFHVVSALGAQAHSPSFYLRTKGKMEEELKAIGFASLTIYRPALLLGERKEARFGENAAAYVYSLVAPVYPRFLVPWQPISAQDLARVMVREGLRQNPGLHVLKNEQLHAFALNADL